MWMVGLVVGKCMIGKDHLIRFQCLNHFLVLKYANNISSVSHSSHHVNHPRIGVRNWPAPTLGHENQNICNQSCFAVLKIEHCLICLDFDGASVDMVWSQPLSLGELAHLRNNICFRLRFPSHYVILLFLLAK